MLVLHLSECEWSSPFFRDDSLARRSFIALFLQDREAARSSPFLSLGGSRPLVPPDSAAPFGAIGKQLPLGVLSAGCSEGRLDGTAYSPTLTRSFVLYFIFSVVINTFRVVVMVDRLIEATMPDFPYLRPFSGLLLELL